MSALKVAIQDQRDRWFLWYVVCFAGGVASYFALPREPFWPVFAAALVFLAALLAVWRRKGTGLRLMMLVFFLAGFVAAKARVDALQTAVLPATTPTTQITGTVVYTERTGTNRTRLVLQIKSASGIKKEYLPKRIRLSGRNQSRTIFYSDTVSMRARLFPLPGPVRPRGYDFGRKLWFDGVGATGFFYGDVKQISKSDTSHYHPRRNLQKLRFLISQRISGSIKGPSAGFAKALIIGDRSGIDKETINALRAAGLAHILAISGLHMSLVAGGSFWLLRALLALSPGLALNYPIKKWAAVGGLLTGAFYLAISGASIATQRAFIMAAVMFVAILLDRPALSMRNVAFAALALLIFRPEVVLSASFQMSFMAVIGLVGWYEYYRHQRARKTVKAPASAAMYWLQKGFGFFAAIAVTTLVASVCTGLPAAYHFHKVASWSLLGNIVALPVVSLIIMPAAIVAILAMPLGLEFVGLRVMAFGIDFVVSHAGRVASLPNAQTMVSDMSTIAVLSIVACLLWICLWRERLKYAGIVPIFLALALLTSNTRPDILISKFGRNVAIRDAAGFLVLADNKKSRFAAQHWLAANGDEATVSQSAKRTGWTCKGRTCTAKVGKKVILWLKRKPFKRAGVITKSDPISINCKYYQVIISSEPLRDKCKDVSVRIDRFDLWRKGAHSVYFEGGKARVETALDVRGLRPWVVKPIARRKILTNPKPKRQKNKRPAFNGKKRQANFETENLGAIEPYGAL